MPGIDRGAESQCLFLIGRMVQQVLEFSLGDRLAAEQIGSGVESESPVVEQRPPRERHAVRVDPRRRQADHRVAWTRGAAVDDRVELDHAERRPDQVEAVRRRVAAQHLRTWQTSPPGISTPACAAPTASPRPIASSSDGSACSTAM